MVYGTTNQQDMAIFRLIRDLHWNTYISTMVTAQKNVLKRDRAENFNETIVCIQVTN